MIRVSEVKLGKGWQEGISSAAESPLKKGARTHIL
jgi:hypothetical protein